MSTSAEHPTKTAPVPRSGKHGTYDVAARNWVTWVAVLGIGLSFVVPQIRHLFELPAVIPGASPYRQVVFFYVFVGALIVIYLIAGAVVVPLQFRKQKSGQAAAGRVPGWQSLWEFLERRRHAIAAVAAAAGALLLAAYFFARPEWRYLADPPILFTFASLLLSAAFVFLLMDWMHERTARLLLRAIAALLILNLLGESIWWLSSLSSTISPRLYSQWAVLHVFFCVLLFARSVDYWQSYAGFPIRALALVLALVVLGRMPPTTVGKVESFAVLTQAAASADQNAARAGNPAGDGSRYHGVSLLDRWLIHCAERLRQIPDDGPVVFVAASGGGSRAALFTALVLDGLEREPINISDPNVPAESARSYLLSDHILFISSVSGGTLASACYVDSEYGRRVAERSPPHGQHYKPRSFRPAEVLQVMRTESDSLKGIPFYAQVRKPDSQSVVGATYADAAAEACAENNPAARWFFERPYVDDMCADFMAPLLRGALHPGQDRALSVQRSWEQRFGLRDTNLMLHRRTAERLADSTRSGTGPKWPPLLLCNISEVERGRRLIAGFPPLPPSLLTVEGDRPHVPRAWVNLDPSAAQFIEISLAEAVRLSANFPWGFPVARVAVAQPHGAFGAPRDDVHLIDGGVVDNTGIDSLRYVVEGLHRCSDSSAAGTATTPPGEEPGDNGSAVSDAARVALAKSILDELKRRGVLILEIDSGSKPEPPGFLAQQLSGLLEPIGALENAAYATASGEIELNANLMDESLANSQSLRLRRRIGRLRNILADPDLPAWNNYQSIRNVRRITITCNHQDNVMTAWALGTRDEARIFLRFAAGNARLRDELQDYLFEYTEQHNQLAELEKQVAELEQGMNKPRDQLSVDVHRMTQQFSKLALVSQEAQRVQNVSASAEKMFYQGIPLSTKKPGADAQEWAARVARQLDLPADALTPNPYRPTTHPPEPPPPTGNAAKGKGQPKTGAQAESTPKAPGSQSTQTQFQRLSEQIDVIQRGLKELNKSDIKKLRGPGPSR